MSETWKPAVGFVGLYEVSDLGRVRNVARSCAGRPKKDGELSSRTLMVRVLKFCRSRCGGYYRAVLYIDGRQVRRLVHRMVAQAFIPNPNDLPQINHKDGNKLNNRVENLEWVTPQENSQHSYGAGLSVSRKGDLHGMCKLSPDDIAEIRSLRGIVTQRELAKRFGVAQSHISRIMIGRRWKHVA